MMTTANRAIRQELRRAQEAREKLEGRIVDIQSREAALQSALDALGTGSPKATKKRTRTFKGRMTKDERLRQTYDIIRKADRPLKPADLAAEGVPHASAQAAVERLLAGGKVRQVGSTGRGKPIVEYIPTTVTPGKPVDVSNPTTEEAASG